MGTDQTSGLSPFFAGALPRGFSLSKPEGWCDFHDKAGAGVALLPVSNAMLTAWQEGYRGIRHDGTGTVLVSLRASQLSPKDVMQSKFSLVIHKKAIDLSELGKDAIVTTVGAADSR